MYDELVAWLRSWSELPAHCECYESCGECDKQDICATFTNERIITKAWEAADAIEFLQTYKVAFENIISIGGWWMVGQDKNLYSMDVPMNWPPKGTKTVELFPLPEPPKEET